MDKKTVSIVNDNDAQLLDVRSQEEWDSGHAKPAVHIPLQEFSEKTLAKLRMDKPVYVYCQSGNRAGQATNYLKQIGYAAYNIGGLSDWQSAGGKVS